MDLDELMNNLEHDNNNQRINQKNKHVNIPHDYSMNDMTDNQNNNNMNMSHIDESEEPKLNFQNINNN
jgi:hypothetical protein